MALTMEIFNFRNNFTTQTPPLHIEEQLEHCHLHIIPWISHLPDSYLHFICITQKLSHIIIKRKTAQMDMLKLILHAHPAIDLMNWMIQAHCEIPHAMEWDAGGLVLVDPQVNAIIAIFEKMLTANSAMTTGVLPLVYALATAEHEK